MSGFNPCPLLVLAALCGAAQAQQKEASTLEFSGHVRAIAQGQRAADAGPLAAANRIQPGTAPAEPSSAVLQTEWRAATGLGLGDWRVQGVGTLQAHGQAGGSGGATAWFNEAWLGGSGAGWHWSVGKKTVSWDVGYAFRPNDVVQREQRRTLMPTTLVGRPVLMAERFVGDAAWSLVWDNPWQSRQAPGVAEPALAARYYRRGGVVDWHGFARWGARTGVSVGAAAAWVASDAVELHASWHVFQHVDRASGPAGSALSAGNPWQNSLTPGGQQLLVGGTWTGENQLSLLTEAWWDGAAPSRAEWAAWRARNQALPGWLARGAPAAAVAGNLAWQAQAFAPGTSLQRANVFVRLSGKHEAWEPALDWLHTPADHGSVWTASLSWQGDRVRVEGGLRAMAGPRSAIVRQLPVQRQAYAAVTWAF